MLTAAWNSLRGAKSVSEGRLMRVPEQDPNGENRWLLYSAKREQLNILLQLVLNCGSGSKWLNKENTCFFSRESEWVKWDNKKKRRWQVNFQQFYFIFFWIFLKDSILKVYFMYSLMMRALCCKIMISFSLWCER